jgi:hypothetical protein
VKAKNVVPAPRPKMLERNSALFDQSQIVMLDVLSKPADYDEQTFAN